MGERQDEKLRDWLRLGGARQMRRGVAGEVYSVHGPERERETAAGGTTLVVNIMDPRLKLSPRQRWTAREYGACVEAVGIAGGSEFMKIKVDGGQWGGGGVNAAMMDQVRKVSSAKASLGCVPALRYAATGRTGAVGPHRPVSAQFMADAFAVNGWNLSAIGILRGWWSEHRDKGGSLKQKCPDRQRKKLAEYLCTVLDAIDAGWEAKGLAPGHEIGSIEVD